MHGPRHPGHHRRPNLPPLVKLLGHGPPRAARRPPRMYVYGGLAASRTCILVAWINLACATKGWHRHVTIQQGCSRVHARRVAQLRFVRWFTQTGRLSG
jgi:hypothetical protein